MEAFSITPATGLPAREVVPVDWTSVTLTDAFRLRELVLAEASSISPATGFLQERSGTGGLDIHHTRLGLSCKKTVPFVLEVKSLLLRGWLQDAGNH